MNSDDFITGMGVGALIAICFLGILIRIGTMDVLMLNGSVIKIKVKKIPPQWHQVAP